MNSITPNPKKNINPNHSKLSLYNTNNQLIATKTFDDLPAQGLLQQLNDQSIVFGATDYMYLSVTFTNRS
ncbi:hypothetical protein ABEW19_27950 [Paenibacillus illinoisensis]|uniref:hypothetical protein n=1 Tax=Paenibacillus illinoisensis TaxID=59845 RepID=UPI003D2A71F4